MPIFTTQLERRIMYEIDSAMRSTMLRRFNLGGVAGVSGGVGTPPGGFSGQLIQQRVTYDSQELTTSGVIVGQETSLVHNLNRIRGGWALGNNSIKPRHIASGVVFSGMTVQLDDIFTVGDALSNYESIQLAVTETVIPTNRNGIFITPGVYAENVDHFSTSGVKMYLVAGLQHSVDIDPVTGTALTLSGDSSIIDGITFTSQDSSPAILVSTQQGASEQFFFDIRASDLQGNGFAFAASGTPSDVRVFDSILTGNVTVNRGELTNTSIFGKLITATNFTIRGGYVSSGLVVGSGSHTRLRGLPHIMGGVTVSGLVDGAYVNSGGDTIFPGGGRARQADAVLIQGRPVVETAPADTQVLAWNNDNSRWEPANQAGGGSFANPTASVGLTVVNGVAATAMRSDAAPPLDVGIAPTWTAAHIFSANVTISNLTATRVTFAGAAGLLSDDADFTFDGDQLALASQGIAGGVLIGGDAQWYRNAANVMRTPDALIVDGAATFSTSITDSSLTATRVVFAGASGILADAANFTYTTGTGQLALATTGSGAGILLGGDVLLYRSAANVLRTPDSLTVDGVILSPVGSAGAPPFGISGDATTGIYSTGAGALAMSSAGNEMFRFDEAGVYTNLHMGQDGTAVISATPVAAPTGIIYGIDAQVVIHDFWIAGFSAWYLTAASLTIAKQTIITGGLQVNTGAINLNNSQADHNLTMLGTADAELFFMDAGANRIGISTNVPSVLFHVAGAARINDALTFGSAGDVSMSRTAANVLTIADDLLVGTSDRAYVGTWSNPAYVTFVHEDVAATSTSYALLQHSGGATFLNTASGTTLALRINNVAVAQMQAGGTSNYFTALRARFGTLADPGTWECYVGGQAYVSDYLRADGGLTTDATNPGTNRLHVGDYAVVLGGVHVGGTSDPGTDNLLVDGDVTFSSVKGARVYNSSNISVATATWTAVTFNSERFDTQAWHSTGSNTDRITVDEAGVYLITGTVRWAANATGVRGVKITVGATDIAMEFADARSSGVMIMHISTIWQASASNIFRLYGRQDSGGNLNLEVGSSYSPEFSVMRLY